MQYYSTRDQQKIRGLLASEAIEQGAAPDGGLYLPEEIPRLAGALEGATRIAELAAISLMPFFADDSLAAQLSDVTHEAFDFPVPLTRLEEQLHVLELFHGPTAAFKDFGARFLASCMQRSVLQKRRTVLVATSGDTGGAVASAFIDKPGIDVVILFPDGRVSPLQARQLTCWGANVRSFAVQGSFDDCQRLVKEAFANRDLAASLGLTSANSINVGRLLPQIVYYLLAAQKLGRPGERAPGFVVPSGNLGNVTACVLAKLMGAAIGPVILACNANQTVPEFFATGVLSVRESVATLASAMDVGDPSNLERLRQLFAGHENLQATISAVSASDEQIGTAIRDSNARWGRVWCPHTATALHALARLPAERLKEREWVLVATAHAAKFAEVVEPLIGARVALPAALEALLERPVEYQQLRPRLSDLASAIS